MFAFLIVALIAASLVELAALLCLGFVVFTAINEGKIEDDTGGMMILFGVIVVIQSVPIIALSISMGYV